jgi:hypothetical protein
MSLISLVITLAVIGVLLWLFNTYATMVDGKIKQIINAVVIICVVLWLLQVFGVFGLADIPVPRLSR